MFLGCDTGFGFSLAQHLHKIGFTVFAGCLHKDGEGAKHLEQLAIDNDRMHVLQLDVTKEEDWNQVLISHRRTGQCLAVGHTNYR